MEHTVKGRVESRLVFRMVRAAASGSVMMEIESPSMVLEPKPASRAASIVRFLAASVLSPLVSTSLPATVIWKEQKDL
jgi:hypothetical protein